MKSPKREQYMLLIDHMDSTLSENRSNVYALNVTFQEPNTRDIQTQLTLSLTILTRTRPSQKIQQQLQHHN